MFRKFVCILSAAGVLALVGLPARAEQELGSICVIPDWCEIPVTGGTVTVQNVGKPVQGGYTVTDGLADWMVWEDELGSDMVLNLALANKQAAGATNPVERGMGAVFQGLEAGVYLISQKEAAEGYSAFAPFLMVVPSVSGWNLTASPDVISLGESPKTGDHPAPIIAAMGISFLVTVLMILVDRLKK